MLKTLVIDFTSETRQNEVASVISTHLIGNKSFLERDKTSKKHSIWNWLQWFSWWVWFAQLSLWASKLKNTKRQTEKLHHEKVTLPTPQKYYVVFAHFAVEFTVGKVGSLQILNVNMSHVFRLFLCVLRETRFYQKSFNFSPWNSIFPHETRFFGHFSQIIHVMMDFGEKF